MDAPLLVVVAIFEDNEGRFLITKRPLETSHGGYWEFPGGKVESGETISEALLREIQEELGLHVIRHQSIGEVHHTYPTRRVCLKVQYILAYEGLPTCREGQLDLQWVSLPDFHQFHFPAANEAIVALIHQYKG